jgi:hypothetical protein
MPQSQIYTAFEQKLILPKERLVTVVENLLFSFLVVPNALPTGNYMSPLEKKLSGALALTSHRIIASWEESKQCWKTLHIPSLNNVTERPLRSDHPSWSYQAIMMLPGGLVLVVQTQQPNAEHAKQLSSLLNEAIMRFGVFRDDTGSIASIISYEEEKAKNSSNQDDDNRKKKEE